MENKKKYVYYMQPSMADEMESMLGEANATSKSDFINIAVRFYLDYLHNKKSVDFISPMLARTIKSEVGSVEKHISEMLYKLAVEQSKLTVALACNDDFGKFDLEKLNEYCAQTVAENNGVIDFKEAEYYKEFYHG
jgi:hypothetical protein